MYALLLKPKTTVYHVSNQIKKLKSWDWYISQPKEWGDLLREYVSEYNEGVTNEDFRKACWKLKKHDPEFKDK